MTSPHVSEQEVEAAARAIHKIWYDKWPNPECTQCMEVARAALTAAAQVRERAPHMPLEPTENMLVAARDWSLGKYGKPIGNDAARGCWRVMYVAAPASPLLPIYGATEPDSGPDVLGERKGIIGNFDEK